MQKIPAPEKNLLFSALSPESRNRLLPQLELVRLERDHVLYEPNHVLSHIYFPIDAIVALIYVIESGASSEVSLVGNEGIVSIFTLLSNEGTCSQAWVMSAGYAYRLPKHAMQEEIDALDSNTLSLLLRYIQALITQLSLTAVCNRHHSIEQQLCRLLLLSLDRLPCNNLSMTQEMISNMLGVRREGITEAAGKLQKLGIINYCRGHITILDRPKLERLACECYAVVKKETDRLLPYTSPTGASSTKAFSTRVSSTSDSAATTSSTSIASASSNILSFNSHQAMPGINPHCTSCFKFDNCSYVRRKTKRLKKETSKLYIPVKTLVNKTISAKNSSEDLEFELLTYD